MDDSNRNLAVVALIIATTLVACGDDGDPDTKTRGDASVETMDAAPSEPAKSIASLRVQMTVPSVPPGTEGTKCVQLRLGNEQAVHINKVHNRLRGYSHHFIVSTVTDPQASEKDVFDCAPFRAPLSGAPLTVTQKHDEEINLPRGVAYSLAEDQLMHLELHYINTSDKTVDVSAESELFVTKDTGPIQEAGFLIIGTMNIEIPPRSEHTTGDLFLAAPAELQDLNYYAFTGHTHRFGKKATLGLAKDATSEPDMIYAPAEFDWSAPDVKYVDPAIKLPSGGGFRFRCDWDNPTDETIRYGESALTEMCFFWAYYYPKLPKQQTLIMRPGAAVPMPK